MLSRQSEATSIISQYSIVILFGGGLRVAGCGLSIADCGLRKTNAWDAGCGWRGLRLKERVALRSASLEERFALRLRSADWPALLIRFVRLCEFDGQYSIYPTHNIAI